jgi:hypothetical protein
MLELTSELSDAATLEDVATIVVDHGRAALDAGTVGIWLVGPQGDAASLLRWSGLDDLSPRFSRVPLERAIPIGEAMIDRTAVWLEFRDDFRRRFPGYEARYVNQIAVSPGTFSAPGDSGSLMVTQSGNQPVALLFAGDGTLTIGNPIIPVLQRFNVTIDGTPAGPGPPGVPTALSSTAGDGQVALSWTAPSFDGGSQISGYKLYRGTSPNPTTALATLPPTPTSYVDQTATNGTTYYYKVSALNGNGEGPLSNEASATPIAAVAPTSLSAPLDDFNRANENPLSDAGRWTNAIIGGESGLNVSSNQLACSVATTCTAWRNNASYGQDVEVWARLSTLPGDNNQIRLYARLQMPGASAGYLLRTNQTAGVDEVWLERFNGGAIRLLTIAQELAADDTLLLRVKGSTVEAWRLPSGGCKWIPRSRSAVSFSALRSRQRSARSACSSSAGRCPRAGSSALRPGLAWRPRTGPTGRSRPSALGPSPRPSWTRDTSSGWSADCSCSGSPGRRPGPSRTTPPSSARAPVMFLMCSLIKTTD